MVDFLTGVSGLASNLCWPLASKTMPLLATATEVEADEAIVVAGVLLSLIVIYLASKIGGEICVKINLPPVLGDLVGGVIVGVSALKLLAFYEPGDESATSLIMNFLENTTRLEPGAIASTFQGPK